MSQTGVRFPLTPLSSIRAAAGVPVHGTVEEVRGILAGANPVIGSITPSDTDPECLGSGLAAANEPRWQSADAILIENPDLRARAYRVGAALTGKRNALRYIVAHDKTPATGSLNTHPVKGDELDSRPCEVP
jgi:hypothetical protein